MHERFTLDAPVLEAVREGLLNASVRLATCRPELPVVDIPSVSGIGADIERFLHGIGITRRQLADEARAGSMSISALLLCSGELDAALDATLARPLATGSLLASER